MIELVENLQTKLEAIKELITAGELRRADAVLIGYRLEVELLQRELWLAYTKSGVVQNNS